MFYLQKLLQWLRNRFFAKELELAVVGLQNAGKSTLINSLQTGQFMEDSIPTVGVNIRQVKQGKVTLKIWDLGGQRRYWDSWEKYCASSNCIIFVVDSSSRESIEVVKQNLDQLLSWDSVSEIPLLILGNKNDIDGHMTEQELVEELELKKIKDWLVACYSISAKNQTNLDIVLKWLTNLNPNN